MLSQAKGFETVTELVGEWTGEDEMKQIIEVIEKNPPRLRRMYLPPASVSANGEALAMATPVSKPASANGNGITASAMLPSSISSVSSGEEDAAYTTPQNTQNPEPPSSGAPFLPKEFQTKDPLPAKADPLTPTPTVAV